VDVADNNALSWAASGETLTVIPDAGGASYSFTGGGSGTSASFEGSLDSSPSGDYYAVYPSTTSTSKTAVVLDNSASQDGTSSQATFMWGKATYSAGDLDFGTFNHLGSLIKLGLDFTNATSVSADSAIDFTVTLYNVTTSATVDLTATPNPSYDATTKGNITVNVSGLQLSGTRGYIYIRLLPGDALVNTPVKVVVGGQTLTCYVNSGANAASAAAVGYGKIYKTNKNLLAEDPFFYGTSVYGVYDLESKSALKAFSQYSDQIQRETSSSAFAFRIVNAKTNKYVELSGLPTTIAAGDALSGTFKQNCIESLETSSAQSAYANTVSGNTIWIVADGLGFIIKK